MIICKNICKNYENKIVLENINYCIGETGIYSLIGTSGCGKTTLSRIIMKLEKQSSGTLHYSKKVEFSTLFPENRLIPNLNAFKNINYVLNDKDKTNEILNKLELYEDRNKYPIELSNGMKRRVALGRALGYKSDILVLDEPYNGLDHRLRDIITDIFIEESRKKAILLIDHNTDIVKVISTDILDLSKKGEKKNVF